MGVDLAWGMCRVAQQRLHSAGLSSRLVRGSVATLPFPTATFDSVVSTFAFSGFPDGQAAMAEMVRVTNEQGRLILVDIGLPADGNRVGTFWARLWEKAGDFLYDQPSLMQRAGLDILTFEEFGPGKHIRIIVGGKS